jgi:hypothetical protein
VSNRLRKWENTNKGFKKPITGFPAAINLSFKSATTLAKIGLEQLVPSSSACLPFTQIGIFSPCALTSGVALPDALYIPLYVDPSAERYVETAEDW